LSKTTSTLVSRQRLRRREDGTRGSVHFNLSLVTRSKASKKKQTFEIGLQSGRCHPPRKSDCKQTPGACSLPTEPHPPSPTSPHIANTTTSETSVSSLLGLLHLFDLDPNIAHRPDAKPQHQAILLTNLLQTTQLAVGSRLSSLQGRKGRRTAERLSSISTEGSDLAKACYMDESLEEVYALSTGHL
jgi:hypothetical protein